MQYRPLKIEVPVGDSDAAMYQNVVSDDNMNIVLGMVSELHNKHYVVKDFRYGKKCSIWCCASFI